MKKWRTLFSAILVIIGSGLLSIPIEANTQNDEYAIVTALDSNYHVNLIMSLHDGPSLNQKFKFSYVSKEKAYKVTDLSSSILIGWNGTDSLNNIVLKPNYSKVDSSDLWILKKANDGSFTIHNKKNSRWVWNVLDTPAYNGDIVNLSLYKPTKKNQIFYFK